MYIYVYELRFYHQHPKQYLGTVNTIVYVWERYIQCLRNNYLPFLKLYLEKTSQTSPNVNSFDIATVVMRHLQR